MQYYAFPAMEQPLLDRLARIGVGPGREFKASAFPPAVMKAIDDGVNAGREEVRAN